MPSQHSQRGLTLIELVVVIAIIGLAIPAVLTSYFAILRQQTATIRMQNLQMKGSQIMDIITQAIQSNTRSIEQFSPAVGAPVPVCDQYGSSATSDNNPLLFALRRDFTYGSPTPQTIEYYSITPLAGGDLEMKYYDSGYGEITPSKPFGLFTKDYKIVDSSFSLSCYNANEFAPPRVLVKFTIQDANPNYTDMSLEFKTFIQLPR